MSNGRRAAGGLLAAAVLAACSGADGAEGPAPAVPTATASATASATAPATSPAAPPAGAPAGPASPAPSATPPPERLTLAFTGDILVHSVVYQRAAANGRASGVAYDFRPMLARLKPHLTAADLAICHLETPLSADNSDLSGYPVFSSPHEVADAVADAGYDGCSTASNHSIDRGARGVVATLDALDAAGVGHVGTARTGAEAARPEVHEVRGVQVALLDYTYGLNGLTLPAGQPYLVNLIDLDRILRDARAARAAGADLVVLQMHWGAEYQVDPTDEQRAQARTLLASPDIDVIVGGHAHVVQPVEKVGGEYVVYGLGNSLSNQSAECCPASSQDGVVVTLHSRVAGERVTVERVTYTPTYVDRAGGFVVLPVAEAYADAATPPALRTALAASWRRTVGAMTRLGAPGLAPDVPAGGLPPDLPAG